MATFFHVEILDGVPINQYENLFLQLQAKKCRYQAGKTSKFNICKLVKKRSLKVGQLWNLQDIHGTENDFSNRLETISAVGTVKRNARIALK